MALVSELVVLAVAGVTIFEVLGVSSRVDSFVGPDRMLDFGVTRLFVELAVRGFGIFDCFGFFGLGTSFPRSSKMGIVLSPDVSRFSAFWSVCGDFKSDSEEDIFNI